MLEVINLHVQVGEHPILKGVNLKVKEHSVVAVLGANGAGKTTLMRTISGLYRATKGSVAFLGTPITNNVSHHIVSRGIAQVPEGRQVFGGMTVRENLLLGRVAAGGPPAQQQIERMLEQFPSLRDRLNQSAGSLSGGEQQMLAIARALMSRPRLLLLDEPSLGLAPKVVDVVFELIAAVRASGVSVLLVEQNARRALSLANYAYVLERGEVVIEGKSGELDADPRVRTAYLGH